MISFLIFVFIFSVNVSYAEDCHIHPQRENCLDPDQIKRGGRLLNAIGELSDDFENIARNIWIDESQTGVRWRIENSKSPREPNNPAPKPSVGENYMRVDRGATVSFGVAVLRSQIFRIPSSTNVSISFDFWIRSKWPQFTNLELHFNENGNERLLVSLSKYSDINNRNWVPSPELSLRSQSQSSNTSLVFYAYCGMDVEDAVVIDNIRLIDSPQCPMTRSQRVGTKDEWNVKNGRIAGGEETIPNEFPWMAHINFTTNGYICSGSLISNRWILTSATCVNYFYGDYYDGTITLGAHKLSSTNENQLSYNFTSTAIHSHPDWNRNYFENDICLIKLPEDVPFSDYNIQPIRLPYPDDSDQVCDPVVMAGWGVYDYESNYYSSVLRKAESTVIPYDNCQQYYSYFNATKLICSDGSQGRRYCNGDGGSPLLYYREDEQKWFIIGVASGYYYCGRSPVEPNLYTRVRYYLDWIYKTTGLQPVTKTTSIATTTKDGTTTKSSLP